MKSPSTSENSCEITSLPTRPRGNYEKKFKALEITSNHYKVDVTNLDEIFLYKVELEPKIADNDRTNRNNIYSAFRSKLDEVFHNPVCSGNVIYTTKKSKWQEQKTGILTQYNDIIYKLTPKFIKTVKFRSNNPVHEKMQLMFLNNLLRDSSRKLKYVEIGKTRRLFDVKNGFEISNLGVFIMKGYSANFCKLEKGLFLKIDTFTRAMPNNSVLGYINDYIQSNRLVGKQERRNTLNERLVGKTIMANYGNNMCWVVDRIIFDKKPSQIFLHGSDEKISVESYFFDKYKLTLNYPNQPVIEVQASKQSTFVLPELCIFTDFTLISQDDYAKKQVTMKRKQTFDQRVEEIKTFRQSLNRVETGEISTENLSKKLQIIIDKDFYKLKSKKLDTPEIQFGGNSCVPKGQQASFRLINDQLFDPRQPINVAVIFFDNTNVEIVSKVFQQTPRRYNLKFSYKLHNIKNYQTRQLIQNLRDRLDQLSRSKEFNMYLVILPARLKDSYGNLKQYCCNELGILTQFCVDTSLNKKQSQSIVTKILLQMSAKIGNVLWNPKLDVLNKKRLMIVGLSCGVEETKVGKRISYCVSLDQRISKFYSNSITQASNSPIIQNMQKILSSCLSAYQQFNMKDLPQQIIIIKDGVSHGQIDGVRDCEVPSCTSVITRTKHNIKLTYIVLDKKPTQKFFNSFDGKHQNVKSGTLINEDLVEQNQDQFYLISQSTNQGTIVPTFYQVVYSNSRLERGMIEEILYHQCFNYCNWSGSIKIPSMNQYAKKYSDFVSVHLKGKIPENMNNKLFYI